MASGKEIVMPWAVYFLLTVRVVHSMDLIHSVFSKDDGFTEIAGISFIRKQMLPQKLLGLRLIMDDGFLNLRRPRIFRRRRRRNLNRPLRPRAGAKKKKTEMKPKRRKNFMQENYHNLWIVKQRKR